MLLFQDGLTLKTASTGEYTETATVLTLQQAITSFSQNADVIIASSGIDSYVPTND